MKWTDKGIHPQLLLVLPLLSVLSVEMMHRQSKFRKTLSFTFVISVLIFSTFTLLKTPASAQIGPTDLLNETATATQQNTTPIANQTLSKSQMGESPNTTAGSEDIVHVV